MQTPFLGQALKYFPKQEHDEIRRIDRVLDAIGRTHDQYEALFALYMEKQDEAIAVEKLKHPDQTIDAMNDNIERMTYFNLQSSTLKELSPHLLRKIEALMDQLNSDISPTFSNAIHKPYLAEARNLFEKVLGTANGIHAFDAEGIEEPRSALRLLFDAYNRAIAKYDPYLASMNFRPKRDL